MASTAVPLKASLSSKGMPNLSKVFSPTGLLQCLPIAKSLKTKIQQPVGLSLLAGYQAHNILIESLVDDFRIYIGRETELIFLFGHLFHEGVFFFLCHTLSGFLALIGTAPITGTAPTSYLHKSTPIRRKT